MIKAYTIPGTKGITVQFGGRIYKTVENIHYEIKYGFSRSADDCGMLSLSAQCTTDDQEIMRGHDGEESDWFPPEAMWSVCVDELDEWVANRDWQKNLDGVLTAE